MLASRICFFISFLSLSQCSPKECNGPIESVVLYKKQITAFPFSGNKIYVDVKNKGGIGVRKTLYQHGKLFGTFNNIVIIDDYKNQLINRKWICFDNTFARMIATDGAKVNEEDIPEIRIYD